MNLVVNEVFYSCLVWIVVFILCLFSSGNNPTPSESQNRAIDKLCQKLAGKPTAKTKNADEEDLINFDLRSKTRVILFEGKVLKRSESSTVIVLFSY